MACDCGNPRTFLLTVLFSKCVYNVYDEKQRYLFSKSYKQPIIDTGDRRSVKSLWMPL